MDFDAASILARMRADLKNATNKIEGGFTMDNLQAVSEEFARISAMYLEPLKALIAQNHEELITSGNENHYVYWAKQVSGVGNARAVGLRDGSGIVTVAVVTSTADTPAQELLDKVAAHILTQRPVGGVPVIVAAEAIDITVTGQVTLRSGYTIDDVTNAYRTSLQAQFQELAFGKQNPSLSYHKLNSMLFAVEGVADVLDFKINGAMASIDGTFDQFFRLAEVSLYAAN